MLTINYKSEVIIDENSKRRSELSISFSGEFVLYLLKWLLIGIAHAICELTS